LLGQSHWKWPLPWQRWHLMSDVRPVGTMKEEGFAAVAPYKIKALLGFVAQSAAIEGVDNVEGAWEAEDVVKE
jgi:hypothetical protein